MTAMMPSTEVVVIVVIEEAKTEERKPYIGIPAIVAAVAVVIVIIIAAVIAAIMIVIVITGPAMTMPSLVTAVPSIPLAAMPPVHLLHKVIAHCRHCSLNTGQPGR